MFIQSSFSESIPVWLPTETKDSHPLWSSTHFKDGGLNLWRGDGNTRLEMKQMRPEEMVVYLGGVCVKGLGYSRGGFGATSVRQGR